MKKFTFDHSKKDLLNAIGINDKDVLRMSTFLQESLNKNNGVISRVFEDIINTEKLEESEKKFVIFTLGGLTAYLKKGDTNNNLIN